MLTVKANGDFVFAPSQGFVGRVPAIPALVRSSDGQSTQVTLNVRVTPLLLDGNESLEVVAGTGPVTANVLDNSVPPTGTTLKVTSFSLPGFPTVYPVGPTPVAVVNPVTGVKAGSVAMLADGTITFTPALGFSGQVPPILYTVASSDGQVRSSTATIKVLPRKRP